MDIPQSEFAAKTNKNPVEADKSLSPPLIFAVVLGLLGAMLNSFKLELAYNITLIIGNFAFIIAAAYLRPALTLLCAFICIAPLIIILGHPFGFITFGLEALFVSYMRGRGWYLPTADFVYWLVIGMPLTATIIWLNNTDAEGYIIFSLFKQGINAIFYTALAVILIFAINGKLLGWIKSQQPPLVKNLKQYLYYILWVMSAFFVVGVCLFLSRSLSDIQDKQFESKLNISNQYLGQIVENHVKQHKQAVEQTALHLSTLAPSNYDEALVKAHQLYAGFLTMLIANKAGEIVTSSPLSLMKGLPQGGATVTDRAYFSQAMLHQSVYLSPVFLGRGFGAEPIVAISAPFYDNNRDKPVGIVEGSLNLNLFSQFNRSELNIKEIEIVLTDINDNVIYADKNLALATLSKFTFSFDKPKFKDKLMVIETYNSNNKRYLYHQSVLSNGWKIFTLIEHDQILQLIEQQYLTIFIALALIFALVILLSSQFANTLNRPLAFALNELAHGDGKVGYKAIPDDAPTEFLSLYNDLQQSKEKLLKQQFILEEKVEQRTKELHEANKRLKKLVNKDSLTGLYNRRYLEGKFSELQAILSRNNAAMVVAMLDLDHFKKLNDQFGHLVGDDCLAYVGELMKRKFDRRSDIVARFGGEEFLIVAQYDDQGAVLEKLEELREEIAGHNFNADAEKHIGVTISIGAITSQAMFSEAIDDWIRHADEQLYKAKNTGRNKMLVNHL